MAFDLVGKAVKFLRLPTVDYLNAPIKIIPAQQNDVNRPSRPMFFLQVVKKKFLFSVILSSSSISCSQLLNYCSL